MLLTRTYNFIFDGIPVLDEKEINKLKIQAATAKDRIKVLELNKRLGEYAATPLREQAIDALCFIIAGGIDLEADIIN